MADVATPRDVVVKDGSDIADELEHISDDEVLEVVNERGSALGEDIGDCASALNSARGSTPRTKEIEKKVKGQALRSSSVGEDISSSSSDTALTGQTSSEDDDGGAPVAIGPETRKRINHMEQAQPQATPKPRKSNECMQIARRSAVDRSSKAP